MIVVKASVVQYPLQIMHTSPMPFLMQANPMLQPMPWQLWQTQHQQLQMQPPWLTQHQHFLMSQATWQTQNQQQMPQFPQAQVRQMPFMQLPTYGMQAPLPNQMMAWSRAAGLENVAD